MCVKFTVKPADRSRRGALIAVPDQGFWRT